MSAMLKRRLMKELSKRVLFVSEAAGPENVVRGRLGAICMNRLGGANLSLFQKETGDQLLTGWVAIIT